jgi:hypothetical protein
MELAGLSQPVRFGAYQIGVALLAIVALDQSANAKMNFPRSEPDMWGFRDCRRQAWRERTTPQPFVTGGVNYGAVWRTTGRDCEANAFRYD